ncbi:MAG: DUF664 domain-containing protein [Fimbriimonadaceae bacterium]|nr:MAG: DUF664 domain-containing protein [Fimbriimonadaceae bacterium]
MTDIPTIIHLTKSAADALAVAVEDMPADRLTWSPTEETRNSLDLLHEVSESALWFAEALRAKSSANLTWNIWQPKLREKAPTNDVGELITTLQKSVAEFNDALSAYEPEELDQPLPGSDWQPSPREISFFPLRNAWYHLGQIRYIQTCYGDFS